MAAPPPRHDAVTAEQLAADLRRLGLLPGATVLVHASLSQLGYVEGGADAVIDALLDIVGPEGTVLFPTLTGTEKDGPDHPPVVDVRSTRCWTGRIPETARQRPGAIRSLHPTHSIAALGASAARLTSGHETGATPCDERSPYSRLIEGSGWILLLGGVTQESNTTLHCLEELAGVPCHLQAEPTDGIVIDGEGRRHIVRNRLHLWRWERAFPKVDGPLETAGALRIGPVGRSMSKLISADALAETIVPILRADPLWLLSDEARAAYPAPD
jgi:aminoglycoside 3-N-acetyltransferase